MKPKLKILVIALLSMMIGFQSCKKGSGTGSSQYGERRSHNHGRACLECHGTGEGNDYWWTVAGSVYKPDLTTTQLYIFTMVSVLQERL
jgi:hypothetical protein